MSSAEQRETLSSHDVLSRQAAQEELAFLRETLNMTFVLGQFFQQEDVSFETILSTFTDEVRQLMHADLCLLFLPDHANAHLLRSVSPQHLASSSPFASITLDAEMLQSQKQPFLLPSTSFPQLNQLSKHFRSGIVIPFQVLHREQAAGLLCCYFNDGRPVSDEQQHSLQIVAHLLAHLLFRDRVFYLLQQRYLIKSFLDQLLQHSEGAEAALLLHARFLNLNLEHPHTVVFIEIRGNNGEKATPSVRDGVISLFEAAFQEKYPGSLLYDDEQILTCVVHLANLTNLELQDWLQDFCFQLSSDAAVHLFIGMSNTCQHLASYRRASSEAIQALRTGYAIHPEGGVTHYHDIRIYEYLTIAPEIHNDSLQQRLEVLLHYDQSHKKKDRLLETLEVYLQCHANMAKAGKRLRVHRNTVEQRLKRIQEVAGLDILDADANVFDLELALRVFKLRLHIHSDS